MRRRLLCVLAAFAAALPLIFLSVDEAPAQGRLTLVELYTAQGCATCPPADAYLADLAERSDVLALSFHVDYWDYIGWKDPFADAAHTRRQKAYADRHGLPYVFTPQMIVDGVFQGSGNDRSRVEGYIRSAASLRKPWVKVGLNRTAKRQVRVTLPDGAYQGSADVIMLRFDAGHRTLVGAGENGGRELNNVHVVRQVRPIATWTGDALDLTVPLEDLGGAGEDFCAIIVQESGQGRILGARYLDLRKGT